MPMRGRCSCTGGDVALAIAADVFYFREDSPAVFAALEAAAAKVTVVAVHRRDGCDAAFASEAATRGWECEPSRQFCDDKCSVFVLRRRAAVALWQRKGVGTLAAVVALVALASAVALRRSRLA